MTDTSVRRKESERGAAGPDALQAEVEADRERLAATIDTLFDRTSPASLNARAKQQVRDYFVTPEGEPRKESVVRVGIAVGCVAGGVAVLWLLRRRFRR